MYFCDKYQPLWTLKYRYAILSGGRGSAKSYSSQTFTRDLLYQTGHKIANTRFTMRSAEKSVIPEFQSKLEIDQSPYSEMPMLYDFEFNGNTVMNTRSGSEMFFMGLKTSHGIQTAALKSIEGLTTWIMEEAEELPDDGTETVASTFDQIDDSIRAVGPDLRTILVWNPSNEQSYIYKNFFEKRGVDITHNGLVDDVLYIYTTYHDNIRNLSEAWLKKADNVRKTNPKRYDHIYMGIPTKEIENALWQIETMVAPFRVHDTPDMKYITVSLDPSVTSTGEQDEAGMTVAGVGYDNEFYVLHDGTEKLSTLSWAKKVVGLFKTYQCDKIIYETNQGGDLVKNAIQGVLPNAPLKAVTAKKGKLLRAEPVAALYEDGKVHHVGIFPELEEEMSSYTGDPKQKSPNRLDSLVYNILELAYGKDEELFFGSV